MELTRRSPTISQPPAEPAVPQGPLHPIVPERHLHGRWLVLARVGWIAVTVTLVILNLIALPDTYVANFNFTPRVLQDLHRLGFSPTLYGILLFGAGEASLVIFFYLFPSGRFAPSWARWCALVVVAYWLAVVFFPNTLNCKFAMRFNQRQ